jgi:hypothetical protein
MERLHDEYAISREAERHKTRGGQKAQGRDEGQGVMQEGTGVKGRKAEVSGD